MREIWGAQAALPALVGNLPTKFVFGNCRKRQAGSPFDFRSGQALCSPEASHGAERDRSFSQAS